MNQIITVESSLEYLACFHFEYSDDIVSFESQPKGFCYLFNDKKCRYTPDFKIVFKKSNSPCFVEIKPYAKAGHPDFITRFSAKVETARAINSNLILLTEKKLSKGPYISNLKIFHRYSGFHEESEHALDIFNVIKEYKIISIQDIAVKLRLELTLVMIEVIRLLKNKFISADIRNEHINQLLNVRS